MLNVSGPFSTTTTHLFMEDRPLGLFCSAAGWTMLSCSESIYMVPHRKIPRPGLMAREAVDILETFFSPLRSCPTCLGLYGRTQRPVAVEPLHSNLGNAMLIFLTVLSGLHPAPLPSVWRRKNQIWQVVLSVIFLPSGRQREPILPNFLTGRAQHGREADQELHPPAVSDHFRAQFLLVIFFLRADTRS